MSDKVNDENAVKVRWGKQPEAALCDLRGKTVNIKCVDGKTYKGQLTGYGIYQVVIVQETGLELVVNKGAMVYVHGVEAQ